MITVLTWVSRGYVKCKPEWVDSNNETMKQTMNNETMLPHTMVCVYDSHNNICLQPEGLFAAKTPPLSVVAKVHTSLKVRRT